MNKTSTIDKHECSIVVIDFARKFRRVDRLIQMNYPTTYHSHLVEIYLLNDIVVYNRTTKSSYIIGMHKKESHLPILINRIITAKYGDTYRVNTCLL